MEKWLKKNLQYITMLLFVLFMIKDVQSCNRKMSLRIQETKFIELNDSLNVIIDDVILVKDNEIDSLEQEIVTRDFIIKDQTNDLKIAGVRVNAADRRADAVQRTAERVKTNTTIEIKGAVEVKDTLNNK